MSHIVTQCVSKITGSVLLWRVRPFYCISKCHCDILFFQQIKLPKRLTALLTDWGVDARVVNGGGL
jgi:hypothetical protein